MLMRMPVPTSAAPQGPARGKGRGNLSPMSPTLACAPPRPRQAKTACVFSRRDTANRPNGFATTHKCAQRPLSFVECQHM